MEETSLALFVTGAATGCFALNAYLLLRRKNGSRLQKVVAAILLQWAFFYLKDYVLLHHNYFDVVAQDVVVLIDGMSLIGYTCLVFELIRPGWATWQKAVLSLLAYLPFFGGYMLWPGNMVIRCYLVSLFVVGVGVFFVWLRQARQYVRYIRDNYSNIDEIDISWLRIVAVFFVVCQLIWGGISMLRIPIADSVYCLLSLILWQVTLGYVIRQKPVTVESNNLIDAVENKKYGFENLLIQAMEQDRLYLNPTLSVKELAIQLGTNRTYLSDYFAHVLNTSFYDYINTLRLEQMSLPLMEQHPELTLEAVAAKSGFQSISTFRRSFQKLKGISPSEYKRKLQSLR